MKFDMTAPCENCPFRSDGKGVPLRKARTREILGALVRSQFPCHKTVDYGDDSEGRVTDQTQHCAGALILLEKVEQPSQMMRICERLGLYDRKKLRMSSPVFNCPSDMLKASK